MKIEPCEFVALNWNWALEFRKLIRTGLLRYGLFPRSRWRNRPSRLQSPDESRMHAVACS
jgi:hypothetical protein